MNRPYGWVFTNNFYNSMDMIWHNNVFMNNGINKSFIRWDCFFSIQKIKFPKLILDKN